MSLSLWELPPSPPMTSFIFYSSKSMSTKIEIMIESIIKRKYEQGREMWWWLINNYIYIFIFKSTNTNVFFRGTDHIVRSAEIILIINYPNWSFVASCFAWNFLIMSLKPKQKTHTRDYLSNRWFDSMNWISWLFFFVEKRRHLKRYSQRLHSRRSIAQ